MTDIDILKKAEKIIRQNNAGNYLVNSDLKLYDPASYNKILLSGDSCVFYARGSVPRIKNHDFDSRISGIAEYGFSTRLGGVSSGCYSSMNVDFKLGDKKENVLENYRILCRSMDIDISRLSLPDQQHHTNVRVINDGDVLNRPYDTKIHDIDAQVTKVPGIALICYGADCGMLLFVDPKVKAVGSCHSGWRGTVNGIPAEVIKTFADAFGSDPADISVFAGPCAGPCCYEVDEKVACEFEKNNFFEKCADRMISDESILKDKTDPEEYTGGTENHDVLTLSDSQGHYMLDLFEAQKISLINAGVSAENIISSKVCTIHNSNLFFSHRAAGKKRGLNCGIIMLK